MEQNLIKEWVKPELKVINFAKTSETVLNVASGDGRHGVTPIYTPPKE